MRGLFLLLNVKLLEVKNRFLGIKGGFRKRTAFVLVLGGGFCLGLFLGTCRVLMHFRSVDLIGDMISRYLLSMVFLVFFCLLIFSHIITSLSNLYLSRDLEFCHSTPVSLEEIFLSRGVLTFVQSSWMLLVFGLPVFLAYAYVYDAPLGFYPKLIHMNVAMAMIAAGSAMMVTMILVRVFPAQRTRDLVVILALFFAVGLYIVFRLLRPERLVDPESFFSIMQYAESLGAAQSPFLPTQWIVVTLWDSLTGSGRSRGFEMILTWSTAGALVVLNIWVAEAVYFDGYSKSQEGKKRRPAAERVLNLLVAGFTRPFGRDLGGILAKDIRTFFRDNTQWSQLLLLGALVVVYVYNFSVLPLAASPVRLDLLQNALAFLNLGLAGFVLSAVCARFVFTAVSGEGEAYWIVRSSPLSPKRYLWGKYLFFLIPILFLGQILVFFTNHFLQVTPLVMALSSATMFLMVFGIVALGVGLGAVYPDFTHQNVAEVSTGYGGLMFMIISSLFIASVVVLEAGPMYILFKADVDGRAMAALERLYIAACFFAVFLLNGVAVWQPMRMGVKALEKLE